MTFDTKERLKSVLPLVQLLTRINKPIPADKESEATDFVINIGKIEAIRLLSFAALIIFMPDHRIIIFGALVELAAIRALSINSRRLHMATQETH